MVLKIKFYFAALLFAAEKGNIEIANLLLSNPNIDVKIHDIYKLK